MGASNAWAGDVSTIYERGQSTAWSTSDYTTTSLTANKWYSAGTGNTGISIETVDKVNYLHISARGKTTTGTSTLTLSRTANTIVTIDAVMNTGSSTFPSNDNRITFKYGAFILNYYTRNSNAEYYINSTKTDLPTLANNIDLTIHLVVNSVDGKISALKVTRGDTSADIIDIKTADEKAFVDGTNYNVAIFEAYCNVSSNNTSANMKSFVVQQETQDVETANITFKYEDTAGNTLSSYKSDQVLEDVAIGATISTFVASPYTDTFYNGTSNKYVYSGTYVVTGGYTTVQEGGITVTLKFTDYPATPYTVKAQVSGSDLTTLATGTAYLDGSTRNFWSKYVNVGGNWYVADETTYGIAITSATTNVAFTATDAIDYFFEAENMECSRYYGSNTNNNSYSNGGGIGVYEDAYLTSTSKVAAGIYTVAVTGIVRNSSKDVNFKISYSTDGSTWNETGKNVAYTTNSSGATTGNVTGVIIPAESYIRLTDATSSNVNDYTDYITLKKTANIPATENIVVTSAGFATYVSNYNLDFTSATTKAYKVNVASKGVATLTRVDEVPAKTPVLLYKEGGNGEGEAITISSDAMDAVTGNDLVAGTGAAVATYETVKTTNYTNMILNVVDDQIGFYFANDKTVATDRAYLHILTTLAPDEVGESRMVMVFADETTGVNDVRSKMSEVRGTYYNLNGQRVEKPAKGLYIVNGKKVIIK